MMKRNALVIAIACALVGAGLFIGSDEGDDIDARQQAASQAAVPAVSTAAAELPMAWGANTLPTPEQIKADLRLATEYTSAADYCLDAVVEWAMTSPADDTPRVSVFNGSHGCDKLLFTYRGQHADMLQRLKQSNDPILSGTALTLQYQDLVLHLSEGADTTQSLSPDDRRRVNEHLREVEAHTNPCDLEGLLRLSMAQKLAGHSPMGSRSLLLAYEAMRLQSPGDSLIAEGIELASQGMNPSEVEAIRAQARSAVSQCAPGALQPHLARLR